MSEKVEIVRGNYPKRKSIIHMQLGDDIWTCEGDRDTIDKLQRMLGALRAEVPGPRDPPSLDAPEKDQIHYG